MLRRSIMPEAPPPWLYSHLQPSLPRAFPPHIPLAGNRAVQATLEEARTGLSGSAAKRERLTSSTA